jgi:hypothetical protein
MLADVAAAAIFAIAPPSLVLADATAAAVFANSVLSLVLAQLPPPAGLPCCRKIPLWGRGGELLAC